MNLRKNGVTAEGQTPFLPGPGDQASISSPLPSLASGVLVIGAGPAGIAAALRLHALGQRVLVVDRSSFPRPKVCGCCLNLAALSALATIRCDQLVSRLAPATLNAWRLTTPTRTIDAQLPGGIALSRLQMDHTLLTEAIGRGIEVRTQCEARVLDVDGSGAEVRLGGQSGARRFSAAILASGLSGGGVSRWLPWIEQPLGPVGAALTVDRLDGVRNRTIHMAYDESGYVGAVRLEDGRIGVAAALHPALSRGRNGHGERPSTEAAPSAKAVLLQSIDRILRRSGLGPLPAFDAEQLLTTPPLRRSRTPGCGRLLAAGDAVSYVEPFTGEGMAWAIRTGIAAADCLADSTAEANYCAAWTRRYALMMRRRQWICKLLSGALARPSRSRWLVRAMTAAPWSVSYVVRQLNRA